MLDEKIEQQLNDLSRELAYHYSKTCEIIKKILAYQTIDECNVTTDKIRNSDYINNLYDEALLHYYKSYDLIQKIMDILQQNLDMNLAENKVLFDNVAKRLKVFKEIISKFSNREKLCN